MVLIAIICLPRHDGQRIRTSHLQLRGRVPLHVRHPIGFAMQDRWQGRTGAVWIQRREDGGVGGDPARHLGRLSIAGVAGHAFAVDLNQQGGVGDGSQTPNLNSWFEEYVLAGWIGDSIFLFNLVYFWPLVFFLIWLPVSEIQVPLDLVEWAFDWQLERIPYLYNYMQILTLFLKISTRCKVCF